LGDRGAASIEATSLGRIVMGEVMYIQVGTLNAIKKGIGRLESILPFAAKRRLLCSCIGLGVMHQLVSDAAWTNQCPG